MSLRVVFDTNTVLSALLFPSGRLAWLRDHWREGDCVPLVCRETVTELLRVLEYPKFGLTPDERHDLLADYLPYTEALSPSGQCPVSCRDANDQMLLDLAHSGHADVLVSGDRDLLVLTCRPAFAIESPETYRSRFG